MVSTRWSTAHTSHETLHWLQHHFQYRTISKKCDVEWAPDSPDLKPLDFYLWGHLKSKDYENRPQSIPELKAAITAQIRTIQKEECRRVVDNFQQRIQVCLQRGGAHFEHVFVR